jgi:hypothetical protein
MRPLGKLQLERLLGLASPSCMLIVGDAVSKSLVKRGLLKANFPDTPEAWHRITPAGLRVLADAYEAGTLEQFMRPFPERKRQIVPAGSDLSPGGMTVVSDPR